MKEIISCSRRTDVPWWYYQWLQDALKEQSVTLTNWVSGDDYTIDLNPENVHSIVLWSKNYANVLRDEGRLKDYNLYFQFTITGYSRVLEPNSPSYMACVKQIEKLATKYSPEQINWRFDPIIFSRDGEEEPTEKIGRARLDMFESMCMNFSEHGLKRCTISFMESYDKVKARFSKRNFECVYPTDEQKIAFVKKMVEIAGEFGIQIYSCSQPLLEDIEGVKKSHCIDGEILTELFGERASKAKDSGQRKACGCSKSRDIGAYDKKCNGNCLYCYANPND